MKSYLDCSHSHDKECTDYTFDYHCFDYYCDDCGYYPNQMTDALYLKDLKLQLHQKCLINRDIGSLTIVIRGIEKQLGI